MSGTARISFIVAALVLAAGTGTVSAQQPPADKTVLRSDPVEVPLDLSSLLPVVDVLVNGEGPFRFVVDTGFAGLCLLDTALVEELKLPTRSVDSHLDDGSGQPVGFTAIAHVQSLQLGDMRLIGCLGVVYDLRATALTDTVQGVIGVQAFANCIATLDFPRATLMMRSTTEVDDASWLSIEFDRDGVMLPVKYAGVVARTCLDTGSTATLVTAPLAEQLPLQGQPVTVGMVGQASGTAPNRKVRVSGEMQAGGIRVIDPILSVRDTVCLLGLDVLSECVLTIDLNGRRIRLERAAATPIATPPFCYAGFGTMPCEGGREIKYVLADSPAAAIGLAVGDIVVAADGRAAVEYDDVAWLAQFRTPRTLSLTVRRGDVTSTVDVDVVVIIP